MGLNKEQILAIVMILAIMSLFGYIAYLGVEGQKLADECRNKYGGTLENEYCYYIEDGNSKTKYMPNFAKEGEAA